ncbi:MAG TPA: ribbon-helix-helix domain-containing protein [Candidatus Pacearchaeota archaeon]|nr:ribbon-helix-helix domain-containing protein [Candidatus Pacearchaeota archaeon]HPR79632.1 ribbon-helix-helix domain-containing protein [Candidatus Pacearchaeota archaeon]
MKINTSTKYKRINITLPNKTIQLLDNIAQKGTRSSFVDQAVRFYVEGVGQANLKKQLREGAIIRSKRDLSVAEDWFLIDEAC